MALIRKIIHKINRSAYLFYPDIPNRTEYKVSSLTILREDASRESVEQLLLGGLERLAQEKKLILCFPNPEESGWCWNGGNKMEADVQMICAFQEGMDRTDDAPLELNEKKIPTYEAMMSTWHPMTDTRYFAGFGDGASMAAAFAAVRPNYVTAMYLKDADMDSKVRQQASGMAVPVWLEDSSVCVRDYFLEANQVEGNPEVTLLENLRNPSQRVIQKAVGEAFWEQIWSQLFAKTRRVNTCPEGDCCDRTDLTAEGFQWFVDDCSVDGTPHTWLIHVPKIVREHEAAKVPVVFFYHGGSDNPAEAAEMSRFHEIGEREGFITVYPWGTNRVSWNMELDPDLEDDLSFCRDLILYMTEHYPIDRQRVYLSGFSNGAGMAQTVAMIYPELVAALGHMDSNWPGARFGYSEVDYQNITPMRIALEKKQQYDWRMPVWYTYGTREVSSPVYRGCSQQHQYDFWKRYNHIPVKETRPLDDPACLEHGVDGDSNETLYPDPRYPKRYYTVQRFFSTDEHSQNLYNFALMHDKGHEVATKDAELAWNYMKQYRRNEDGTACLI